VSSWIKKDKEKGERNFFFAGENEDIMEEWTIYLGFTRAKAIYDEFVQNFGKI
jgi:adenylate cyclase 10